MRPRRSVTHLRGIHGGVTRRAGAGTAVGTVVATVLAALAMAAGVLVLAPLSSARVGRTGSDGWPSAQEANRLLGRGVEVVTPLGNHPHPGENIDVEVAADLVVAGGFDSVRLPVKLASGQGPGPHHRLDGAVLDQLEHELAVLTAHGIPVVVVDVSVIGSREAFVALWDQVATRFADQPPTVLFELANEPVWRETADPNIPDYGEDNVLGPDEWNALMAEAHAVVRRTNPHRTLVIGAPDLNIPQRVPQLELPDDPHLIVTFHQYQPLDFTHQGAGWLPGSDAWLGRTWDGTPAEVDALLATMRDAVCWAEREGLPLYVGEFGTFHLGDLSSRARWTEAVARTAEAEGMSWAYFELQTDGFGVWDRHRGEWRQPLHDALLPPAPSTSRWAEPWADCPEPDPSTTDPTPPTDPTDPTDPTEPATVASSPSAVASRSSRSTPRFAG